MTKEQTSAAVKAAKREISEAKRAAANADFARSGMAAALKAAGLKPRKATR